MRLDDFFATAEDYLCLVQGFVFGFLIFSLDLVLPSVFYLGVRTEESEQDGTEE